MLCPYFRSTLIFGASVCLPGCFLGGAYTVESDAGPSEDVESTNLASSSGADDSSIADTTGAAEASSPVAANPVDPLENATTDENGASASMDSGTGPSISETSGSAVYSGGQSPNCSGQADPPYSGAWEAFQDGSNPNSSNALEVSAAGGGLRASDNCAVYLTAAQLTGWGGGGGLPVNQRNGNWDAVDASRFSGVSLWLRGASTGGETIDGTQQDNVILVEVKTTRNANEDHVFNCPLTDSWTECRADFESLRQADSTAQERRIDLSDLRGFGFVVNRASDAPSVSYDIWLDDIVLY